MLSRADAGSITKLADFVVRSNGVDVLNVAGDLSTGTKTLTVPVDSTMSRVTFSSSGASSMTVKRPDGTTVHAGDPGVDTVMPSGGFVPASILTVAGPAVGEWTVSLDGSGEFSLNVTGVSTLDLSSFRFVHEVPGYGGPFDLPLPGLPPAGRPSTADAFVSGPFGSAAFDLRSRAGDVLQTLALTAVSDPAAGEFTGDVTPPGTPFRVYVTGKDLAGNEFQRAVPAVIQPQVVVVTPPASSELRPGQTSSFAFQVQNLGPLSHIPSDFELKIWGPHSMKGTEGAAIIPRLASKKGDAILDKQTYSAFFETPLRRNLGHADCRRLEHDESGRAELRRADEQRRGGGA